MIGGDAEEARDIEDAVRGVDASACPASRVEPVEDRDGPGSHLRVPCQDLIEGRVLEAVLETGLRPCPMRLVFLERSR